MSPFISAPRTASASSEPFCVAPTLRVLNSPRSRSDEKPSLVKRIVFPLLGSLRFRDSREPRVHIYPPIPRNETLAGRAPATFPYRDLSSRSYRSFSSRCKPVASTCPSPHALCRLDAPVVLTQFQLNIFINIYINISINIFSHICIFKNGNLEMKTCLQNIRRNRFERDRRSMQQYFFHISFV